MRKLPSGLCYTVSVYVASTSTRLGWRWRVGFFSAMFSICRTWPFTLILKMQRGRQS